MPKWTDQQRDAIADRGHSLIVCAAAGSGKTAVLVERIVQLVREGCPIENMLVVTFTNAAAGEMRQRIGEALGKAAREDPALGEQVMALSRASISTLHRFCGNLLREHFQALSIDPGFRIGDEQECGVLSHQAMEDAIYSCYEVGSDAFLAADRCYTQEELSELAFALHRFMMTRPDPWAFLARAQETVRLTGEAFEQSPAARLLADFAGRRLERLCANARETLALCEGENGPLHYAAACGMDVQLTADLAAAAADGYAALHDALHGVTFATLGRKKKTDLFDEDIADRVKARRDALKKAVADVQTAFALTLEDAAADIRMTAAPLDGLAELARTYDALYTAAKRQRGMMDFNDLEHNALTALALPEVRASLRAQYRYVFIDEYQDSSAIQEAIVGSFAREDGLFLVGDVKQSIYRFRQAEPSLFLQKAARICRSAKKSGALICRKTSAPARTCWRRRTRFLAASCARRRRKSSTTSGKSSSAACPRGRTTRPWSCTCSINPARTARRRTRTRSGSWPPSSGRRRLSPHASASWSARRFTTRKPRRKGRCAIAI